MAAAKAPARQIAATTRHDVCNPARKAESRARARSECPRVMTAAALIDEDAWPSRADGSCPNAPVARCAAYTEEKTEPTTATPRVPPSSRVASLTADPTPARAGGKTSRMDSVAGVEISPIPSPMRTIWGTMTQEYDVSTAAVEIQANATPKRTIPVVTTTLVPHRGARRAPTTEATAMLSATGRVRTPADSVL